MITRNNNIANMKNVSGNEQDILLHEKIIKDILDFCSPYLVGSSIAFTIKSARYRFITYSL